MPSEYPLIEEVMTEDITPTNPTLAAAEQAETRKLRRNLVEIEAPDRALALAEILDETNEEFVATAVAARVAELTAKIKAQVS